MERVLPHVAGDGICHGQSLHGITLGVNLEPVGSRLGEQPVAVCIAAHVNRNLFHIGVVGGPSYVGSSPDAQPVRVVKDEHVPPVGDGNLLRLPYGLKTIGYLRRNTVSCAGDRFPVALVQQSRREADAQVAVGGGRHPSQSAVRQHPDLSADGCSQHILRSVAVGVRSVRVEERELCVVRGGVGRQGLHRVMTHVGDGAVQTQFGLVAVVRLPCNLGGPVETVIHGLRLGAVVHRGRTGVGNQHRVVEFSIDVEHCVVARI